MVGSKLLRGAAAVAVAVTSVSGCSLLGDDEAAFKVGDCVRVIERTADFDLKSADNCDSSDQLAGDLYRVQSVLDGSATCPESIAGVEFDHEPHGKTYCLVLPMAYTGSSNE